MPKIEDSISIQVPVQQAYNQWTQFEEFPEFMEGIQSVQQLDETHLQWAAEIRDGSVSWRSRMAAPSRTVTAGLTRRTSGRVAGLGVAVWQIVVAS